MLTRDDKKPNDKIKIESAGGNAKEAMEAIPGRLWEIACKLHGIGELIKFQGGEPALNQSEVNYGIGTLVTRIAEEVEEIKSLLT